MRDVSYLFETLECNDICETCAKEKEGVVAMLSANELTAEKEGMQFGLRYTIVQYKDGTSKLIKTPWSTNTNAIY